MLQFRSQCFQFPDWSMYRKSTVFVNYWPKIVLTLLPTRTRNRFSIVKPTILSQPNDLSLCLIHYYLTNWHKLSAVILFGTLDNMLWPEERHHFQSFQINLLEDIAYVSITIWRKFSLRFFSSFYSIQINNQFNKLTWGVTLLFLIVISFPIPILILFWVHVSSYCTVQYTVLHYLFTNQYGSVDCVFSKSVLFICKTVTIQLTWHLTYGICLNLRLS